jgi:hypothetical protein
VCVCVSVCVCRPRPSMICTLVHTVYRKGNEDKPQIRLADLELNVGIVFCQSFFDSDQDNTPYCA